MFQNKESLIYLTLTVVILSAGFYYLVKNIKISNVPGIVSEKNQEEIINVWEGDLPPLGNPQAPVKVIEFGDFHCPFCVITAIQFYPELEKYLQSGKVVFYFRDFPIPQLHPKAFLVHLGSRCANEQGKYWDFHKKAFEDYYQKVMVNRDPNFTTGDENYLIELAKQLNLNVSQFKECLTNQKYKSQIERDIQDGNKIGVDGTPTFFVNGEKVVGADFEGLKIKIEKYLK